MDRFHGFLLGFLEVGRRVSVRGIGRAKNEKQCFARMDNCAGEALRVFITGSWLSVTIVQVPDGDAVRDVAGQRQ